MQQKGIVMLGAFCENTQIGFVAIEKNQKQEFYYEKTDSPTKTN